MKGNKSKKILIVLIAFIMVFALGMQCFATEEAQGEEGKQTTVTATIKTNKKVNKVEGWTISNDGKTLTKAFSKNTEEAVTLVDEDGNEKNVEVKVSNITTKIAEDDGKDETVTPSKKIPQTGESYVIDFHINSNQTTEIYKTFQTRL